MVKVGYVSKFKGTCIPKLPFAQCVKNKQTNKQNGILRIKALTITLK